MLRYFCSIRDCWQSNGITACDDDGEQRNLIVSFNATRYQGPGRKKCASSDVPAHPSVYCIFLQEELLISDIYVTGRKRFRCSSRTAGAIITWTSAYKRRTFPASTVHLFSSCYKLFARENCDSQLINVSAKFTKKRKIKKSRNKYLSCFIVSFANEFYFSRLSF